MKNWWNSLSTLWKVVVVAATIVVLVLIYDAFTGGVSDIKSWWNNREYQQRMEKVEKIEKENEALREEKRELEKEAADLAAKDAVYENVQQNLDAKGKAEVEKLNTALAQQDKEEAVTEQPTDAYTRCVRVKEKMIAIGSKTAKEINCDEVR